MIAATVRSSLALVVVLAALTSACGTLSGNAVPDNSRIDRVDRLR